MAKIDKRENWNNWFEFLFSCLGYMVGLGNVWRFPYICFKNGGGAFVLPYFLCILVLGVPMVLIEMSISQYSNLAAVKVWRCCPLLKGVGCGMTALISLVTLYYNVIIAWTLYYAAMSFSPSLPWSTCGNHWNTPHCVTLGQSYGADSNETKIANNMTSNYINTTGASVEINSTQIGDMILVTRTATEEFWVFEALKVTNGIENLGTLQWPITLCHCATWVVTALVLVKGIKSSGKIMYVSATLPYLLMLALFIRSLTLPGSTDGLRYFIIPKWGELTKFTVWVDAAMQAFYSIGIGGGVLLTLSSYNNFNTDVCRDAILLPILDGLSSLFAGCVVFATLGYMAFLTNKDVASVVGQGPGIAFMVYPEALSTLPLPQLWSVMFFLMLFLVGMNSQISHIQAITANLTDIYPNFRKRVTLVNASGCAVCLVLGLIFTTQGGIYILQLLDYYTFALSGFLLTFLEVTAIAWLYGVDRLYRDIELMVGYKPSRLWRYFWKFVCPPIILALWFFTIITIKPLKYGVSEYPQWAIGIGWLGSAWNLFPLPICVFIVLKKEKGPILRRIKRSIRPSKNWRPAIPSDQSTDDVEENCRFTKPENDADDHNAKTIR